MMQMQMKPPTRACAANKNAKGAKSKTVESSEEEESASGNESGPSKKKVKFTPRRSNRNTSINKRKRCDSICEDDAGSEDENVRKRKPNPRRAATKVISYNYAAESAESYSEEDEDSDVSDYQCQVNPDEPPPKSFGRIVAQRRGKIGATGPSTTVYAVEENGDPNEGCDLNDLENTEIQFLVKWKGYSYLHCTWESYATLMALKLDKLTMNRIQTYLNKEEDKADLRKRAKPEDLEFLAHYGELEQTLLANYIRVDRIIAKSEHFYLVKWQSLPYVEATWEDADMVERKWPEHVQKYHDRENSKKTPSRMCPALKYRPNFVQLTTQPAYLAGGAEDVALRDYQLHGLNWLIHTWCKEDSVILADEMGLGKTIQTISFLYYLFHEHLVHGPFLIVVPLSTITSWEREFALWAPEMNVISYIGDGKSRKLIRQYEWCFANTHRPKFNVILTSYQIVVKDKAVLNGLHWAVLMVDEAHRLKNSESLLHRVLSEFMSNHRLLITGTPLQNDLQELWSLLHFIMPSTFESWEEFEAENAGAVDQGFASLHAQLEPFILRRVKKDVEKSLPPKVEQILRVEMSLSQKKFYRWLLTKNYAALKKETRGSSQTFLNVIMQLRKCCNHSLLIEHPDFEDTHESTAEEQLQQLIRGSGKLILLDKLLMRLRETGHRVLIFSQMVRMLDIIAEYLELRRFPFQRLDGNIQGEVRKLALDHFNAPSSQDFCFLLSTRAGGLGINLASADTVIIYDSDWNPQNDLQAQARAHRIGQSKKVSVYRLVTKNSVEEQMIERAKKKMILDHLIIQRMDTTGRTALNNAPIGSAATPFDKEELTAILKFGAAELFKSDGVGEEEPVCDIDEILRRAETREDEEAPATMGDELLSSFKMANFVLTAEESRPRREDNDREDEPEEDWDEIIPKNYRARLAEEQRKKEEADAYLPPKRNRRPVQRIDNPPPKLGSDDEASDNNDDDQKEADISIASVYSEDVSTDEDSDDTSTGGSKRNASKIPTKLPFDNFTDAEIRKFVQSFTKFPAPLTRVEAIARDAKLLHKTTDELYKLATYLYEGCKESEVEMKALRTSGAEKDDSIKMAFVARFMIRSVPVNAKNILAAEKSLERLNKILPADANERSSWSIDAESVGLVNAAQDLHLQWNITDDSNLLRGVYEHGMGSWKAIKKDPSLNLADRILLPEVDKKLAKKALKKRVEYLLKVLKNQIDKPKSVSQVASSSSCSTADENGLNHDVEKSA